MRLGFVTISPFVVSLPPRMVRSAMRIVSRVGGLRPEGGDRTLGICVACREPVHEHDPFLRYGGAYYHAGLCVERDPPALRNSPPSGPLRGRQAAGPGGEQH